MSPKLGTVPLALEITEARAGFRRVYGVVKTWHQLKRNGVDDVGLDRVGRVMKANGWQGVTRGKNPRTTVAGEAPADLALDLVDRDFAAWEWQSDVAPLWGVVAA